MFREFAFYDRMTASTYVLVPLGERPFAGGEYDAVAADEAVQLVCRVLRLDRNHALQQTLGIGAQRFEVLERLVGNALRGVPRWQPLRQVVALRSSELSTQLLDVPSVAAVTKKPTSWIALKVCDERQQPLASHAFELTLPNGEVRSLVSDAQGKARVEFPEPGTCKLRMPELDLSAWKFNGAHADQVEQEPERTHTVAQGESLTLLAPQYGFHEPDKVWSHGKNAGLRDQRKDANILSPGDQLTVPPKQIGQADAAAETEHQIVVASPKAFLRLNLLDDAGKPLDGVACQLLGDGKTLFSGSVSGGALSCAIPSSLRSAKLVMTVHGQRIEQALMIGHLDPVQQLSGVQARLANLGFYAGATDGKTNAALDDAVLAFREHAGLSKGTQVDDALRSALEQEHKS